MPSRQVEFAAAPVDLTAQLAEGDAGVAVDDGEGRVGMGAGVNVG